jgi:polysaccharide pyruvyl transferase WcaK-like protein
MKIAILTLPLGNNYGGILQAFALQTILEKMGHDVVVIDRKPKKKNKFFLKTFSIIKRLIFNLLGKKTIIRIWATKNEQKKIYKNLYDFVDKNIKLSRPIKSSRELKKFVDKNNFDAFIVGSDQVWRPKYSPCLFNFFLDFIKKNKKIIKISYAASFGSSKWEYTQKQTQKCVSLLKNFHAVSVREDSAKALCKYYFNVDADHLLDPTMLLQSSDYKKILGDVDENFNNIKNKLLVYILDKTEEKNKIISKVSNKLGINPFYLLPIYSFSEVGKNKLKECIFPKVDEWIACFRNAKFVVTDSFHGVIFSIIFNKPFIVIPNKERGDARFTSLLNKFDLNERAVVFFDDKINDIIEKPIDFRVINNRISNLRKDALKFLENSLKNSK